MDSEFFYSADARRVQAIVKEPAYEQGVYALAVSFAAALGAILTASIETHDTAEVYRVWDLAMDAVLARLPEGISGP